MAAAVGNHNFVEFRMEQHASEGVLPASGSPEYADAREIVRRVPGGHGLMPENPIGKSGIAQILKRHVVKRLRTIACAHAIDVDHNETQLSQRLIRRDRAEGLR